MLHIMRKFKNMPIINWGRHQNKADDFIGRSFLNLSEIKHGSLRKYFQINYKNASRH